MAKFNGEILIKRPVSEVYMFVSDPKNNPLWQDINDVEVIDKYKSGNAKKFEEIQVFRGKKAASQSKITKRVKNKRIDYYSVLASYKLRLKYSFEDLGESTKVVISGNLTSGGFMGKSIWFHLISPAMLHRQLGKNLRRLKKLLEE